MIAAGLLGHATLLDSLGTLRTAFADFGCCFGAFLAMFSVGRQSLGCELSPRARFVLLEWWCKGL